MPSFRKNPFSCRHTEYGLPPSDLLRNYTSEETRGGVDRSDVRPLQIIQPDGLSDRRSAVLNFNVSICHAFSGLFFLQFFVVL